MKIQRSIALVTGANRGLGAACAHELLTRGAAKVYAAVRDPATITDPRLTPIRLDLMNQGTLVTAVHVGSIDTDMAAAVDSPKTPPRSSRSRPSAPSKVTNPKCSSTNRPGKCAPRCPAHSPPSTHH